MESKSIKVGFVTLVMLVMVAALILWKSNIRFNSSGYKLVGVYDNIGGLLKGSDVRYRGYKVGKVDEILPTPTEIKVTIWIDENIKIPKGSRTKILFDGLVGENYIGIIPNQKEKKLMVDGDLIYGSSGSDLANFIDLGSQNMVHAEAILESLRNLLTSKQLNQSVHNIVRDLESVSSQVNRVVSTMSDEDFEKNLSMILENLAQFSERMNSSSKAIIEDGDFNNHFLTLLQQLTEATQHANKASENASKTLDDETVEKLQSIIDNLEKFSKMLGSFTYHTDRKETVERAGNVFQTLSKLRMETDASIQYGTADDLAYYLADVNFDVGKHFIRTGIGDRLGQNELLNLQHGYHVGANLSTRIGLFYQKPGLGFDYLSSGRTKMSLEVYNPNQVSVDLLTKYRMLQDWNMLMRLRNNLSNHKWDNLDLGISYSF